MIEVDKVPVRDWNLYFNNTYMLYKGEPVLVQPARGDGRTVLALRDHLGETCTYVWKKADLKNLSVWWPRAGAYNKDGAAVYISRRASRCMKKSCCPSSHYAFKYGMAMRAQVIVYLLRGPNYLSWLAAREALDKGVMRSVAVCRDMILEFDGPSKYKVIYRGEHAGVLENGEYTAQNDMSPVTKLVVHRLAEEGIID